MLKNNEKIKKTIVIILIAIMSGIIFFYQTKKVGLHEDEGYTLCSSVNPNNGVMEFKILFGEAKNIYKQL